MTADHCPSGHRYTIANTRFERTGWRRCRKCHANNEFMRRFEKRFINRHI